MSFRHRPILPLFALAVGLTLAHPTEVRASSGAAAPPPVAQWDWDEFYKYWKKQLGKTTGVVGVVSVVGVVCLLIIMSARKKT